MYVWPLVLRFSNFKKELYVLICACILSLSTLFYTSQFMEIDLADFMLNLGRMSDNTSYIISKSSQSRGLD